MVNPINQNALLDLAMKAWDSTKQPLRSRATILPLGEYEDGSVHPAWPGLLAAPLEGMANFGRLGYDSPEAIADNARSAFDVAGGAMTGSLGVGLAGGMADDAVRVGGSVQNSLLESLQALDAMPQASGKSGMRINTSIPGREIRDFDGGVRVTLKDYPVEENARLVDQLYTIESARGQGLARRAMEDVTREADAARSPLYLHVVPGDGIDHQRLTDFYRSLGFESLGPASMRRSPLNANAKPGAAIPLATQMGERASADLPMDLASRMARAREMGFDTDNVLYHGTGKDFQEFDPGTRGNGTKRNIYLSDNPDIADIYANSQNYGLKGGGDPMIYPLYAKSEKPLIVSDKGADGSFGWVSDNLAAALGVDHPPPGKYSSLYDEARRQGYDQVQIREMTDLGGPQTQYIPLKPEYIRSVNAAFDPAKSDSANLLAANARPGAAVPLMEAALDQPQGIRAYHGSPHDFDRFSLDRIGSGEGWQGQGHGLYFGSVEPISTAYREQLTRNVPIKVGGRDMSPDARNIWANNGFDIDKAIAAAKQMEVDAKASNRPFISSRAGQYASYRAELEAAKAEGVRFPGHQYEVNIRANPDDFLDWATLDEATKARLNTPEGARAAAEQGTPGVRYFDAMSRGAGEGTSNYVVFDDALVDILRKYANAPTGAALPLAAEAQDLDQTDPVLLDVLRQYGMLN